MKEKVFNISKFVMFFVAMIQLALSQIHIDIITKVFATNVGFYLFLFIIFGMIIALNVVSTKSDGKMLVVAFGAIMSSAAGIKYLQMVLADISAGNLLTFQEASISIYFSIFSIVVYLLGTILLFITREK
ncbi:hypothetical protein [Clostridium sp. DL1XJH146]